MEFPVDGQILAGSGWVAQKRAVGVVLLVHGSLEHRRRYDVLSRFLADQGFHVYSYDQLGHGESVATPDDLFRMGAKANWNTYVDHLAAVAEQLHAMHPELPLFLFGHSMGALVVRSYIASQATFISGVILSGTPVDMSFRAGLLQQLSWLLGSVVGKDTKLSWLHSQVYGRLNKPYKRSGSSAAFISSDSGEVERYLQDPLCGKLASIGYINTLAQGLLQTARWKTHSATPDDLPVLVIAGEQDSVSGMGGKGAYRIEELYSLSGVANIQTKIYADARHELLHDTCRELVMSDIHNWLAARSAGLSPSTFSDGYAFTQSSPAANPELPE